MPHKDKDELKRFLIDSSTKGYALGESSIVKESDRSYSSRFTQGDFTLHDNWFGGEPFGGRTIIFYKEKPYWMMVYYGVDTQKATETISVLRKALSKPDETLPVRGPKTLQEGDYTYKNSWTGDVVRFTGAEFISYKGEEVFSCHYVGGLVDQREG